MPWTLTHARLRAAQGDVQGARRIVERVLAMDAADVEATRLLEELRGRADAPSDPSVDPAVLPEPLRFDPRLEGPRFRRALGSPRDGKETIARLERWLARIEGAAEP
jgi:hypothetical protein